MNCSNVDPLLGIAIVTVPLLCVPFIVALIDFVRSKLKKE